MAVWLCGWWFMVLRWSIYELYKSASLNDVIANINILNLWLRFTRKVASLTLSLSNPLFYRRYNIYGSKREWKHERTQTQTHVQKYTMFKMRNEVNRWIGENGMFVWVFQVWVKNIIMIICNNLEYSLIRSMRLPELNTYDKMRYVER